MVVRPCLLTLLAFFMSLGLGLFGQSSTNCLISPQQKEKITSMALLKLSLPFLALKSFSLPIWHSIQLSIPYLAFPSI
jgi:hypothetical protein